MGVCHSQTPRGLPESKPAAKESRVFQSNPLFHSLQQQQSQYDIDEDKLNKIGGLFEVLDIKAGQQIMREGDPITAFYIIVHGHVILTSRSSVTAVDTPIQQLSSNDFFGETALITSKTSEVTATALSDTVLLKMDRQTFQSLIKIVPSLEREVREKVESRTSERLRQIPFFAAIRENKPWCKLDLLGSMFQFEEFTAGQTVFREGEIGDKFFLIVHGNVNISIESSTSDKPIILDTLGPDQHFGEIALIKRTPRTATITCLTDSLFLSLSSSSFHSFLSIAPELSSSFSTLIDARTANVLRTMQMFRAVKENKPWSKVEMLAHMLRYEHKEEGEWIWKEGEDVDKMYIVTSGSVKDTNKNPMNGLLLEDQIITSISCIGGEELLKGELIHRSSVIALSPVSLLSLDRDKWDRWMTLAPEIRTWMVNNKTRTEQQHQTSIAEPSSGTTTGGPPSIQQQLSQPQTQTDITIISETSSNRDDHKSPIIQSSIVVPNSSDDDQHWTVSSGKFVDVHDEKSNDNTDLYISAKSNSPTLPQVLYHRESEVVNPDMV